MGHTEDRPETSQTAQDAQGRQWLEVGGLEDIPRQGSRIIETSTGDVAVFRTVDDRVFALRDRCPHRGGPLSQGVVFGQHVVCPLHNLLIDLETGAAVAPDEGCTPVFPVRVTGGRIWLGLAAKGAATDGQKPSAL